MEMYLIIRNRKKSIENKFYIGLIFLDDNHRDNFFNNWKRSFIGTHSALTYLKMKIMLQYIEY